MKSNNFTLEIANLSEIIKGIKRRAKIAVEALARANRGPDAEKGIVHPRFQR
jgi:hypothetical protein